MSDEHIWPDWYNRQHPKRKYSFEIVLGTGLPVRKGKSQSMNLRPRVLCERPCNNEWGQGLEDRVKPFLNDMVLGKSCTLTPLELRQLIGWATLKFAVSEYAWPREGKETFFTQAERGHLRRTQLPPEDAHFWVGRYVGSRAEAGWIMSRRNDLFVTGGPEPPDVYDTLTVTYSIGQLVIQMFRVVWLERHRSTNFYFPLKTRADDWSLALSPIWPLDGKPITWPPPKVFDDEGFEVLAGRWHEEQPRLAEEDPPTE